MIYFQIKHVLRTILEFTCSFSQTHDLWVTPRTWVYFVISSTWTQGICCKFWVLFCVFNAEYFITFLLKCRFIFMLKGYSLWLIYLLIRYIFILCKENKIYHNLFLKDIISCNIYFKSFHRISNNDKRIGSSRWYLSDNRGTIPIFIWSIISTLLTTVSH